MAGARIAVITDAHANLPALLAAFDAIRELDCDRIVHVGDAVGIGPFPAETLALMLAEPRMQFVMGNHDAWFAHGLPSPRPPWMTPEEHEHHEWTHAALDDADPSSRTRVRDWPWQLDGELAGVRVRWQHYGHASDGGMFVAIVDDPDAATLDGIFGIAPDADATPEVLFFGHHHAAMDRTGVSGVRYVNPGALGTGRGGIARFAVLDIAGDGHWTLTHHRATYDLEPLMRAYDERGVPDRDDLRAWVFGR